MGSRTVMQKASDKSTTVREKLVNLAHEQGGTEKAFFILRNCQGLQEEPAEEQEKLTA